MLQKKLSVSGVEKELLEHYFLGNQTHRDEFPLPDDLEFQIRKMSCLILDLLDAFTQETPRVILINGLQFSGASSLELLRQLLSSSRTGRYLLVLGLNPDHQHDEEHRQSDWEAWLEFAEDNAIVFPQTLSGEATAETHWPELTLGKHPSPLAMSLRAEQLLNMLCFTEARSLSRRALSRLTLNKTSPSPLHARLLTCLGKALLLSGEHDEAVANYDEIIALFQNTSHTVQLSLGYRELAMAHIFRSDFDSAQHCAQLAVKLSKHESDDKEYALALLVHFIACDKANNHFRLKKLHNLLTLLEQHKLIAGQIYVLRNLFAQLPFEPELDHASVLQACRQAVRLSRQFGHSVDLAATFHSRAVVLNQLHKYKSALRCFRISERLREKQGVPRELARIRNGIGFFLCQQEMFLEAHRYYLSALNIVLQLHDYSEVTISLFNLGWLYVRVQEFDHASLVLKSLRDMLRIRGSTHFPFRNIHDVLLLQGMIHIHQGEWSRAEQDLERSNNLEIMLSGEGQFMRPLLQSLIENHHNNAQQALVLLKQASETCHLVQDSCIQQALLLHETAIRIYQQQRNRGEAYQHLKQALHLCELHKLSFARQKIEKAWQRRPIKLSLPSFSLPELELNQLIYQVKQEQRVNQLWARVREMRLLATLQQLTSGQHQATELAHETLRLICAHFNTQAGLVLLGSGSSMHELAQYNQADERTMETAKLKEWLKKQPHHAALYQCDSVPQKTLHPYSSIFVMPLWDVGQQLGTLLLLTYLDSPPIAQRDREILQFIGNQLGSQLVNLRQRDQLIAMSSTDMLTGLCNRQSLQHTLLTELERQLRYGDKSTTLALAFIDLDNFKYYNDTFGHAAGDHVLSWFAQLLRTHLRQFDVACRWGGDEFVLLFPHTTVNASIIALSRVIDALKREQGYQEALSQLLGRTIQLPESSWLGCSIGVADSRQLANQRDDAELLRLADQALYQVKRSGKGTILISGD
ncbi:MAG: diguanylate cyclase [Aeromonadaceae bacterium]